MAATRLFGGLRGARASAPEARRLASAADPIQKLFLDKIREYKKKSGPGGLVEPSKAIQKEMKTDVEKLLRQYGGAGEDMNSFPSLNFGEPKLDPPDEQVPEEAPRRQAAPPQNKGEEQRGAPTNK